MPRVDRTPRRLATLAAAALIAVAPVCANAQGTPAAVDWGARCLVRLERARGDLAALSPRLRRVEVHSAPLALPLSSTSTGVFITVESGRGALFAMIEDWAPARGHDIPWAFAGYGECPDPLDVRTRWLLRQVRNYPTGRQAQIIVRSLPRRLGPAIFTILAAAFDDCGAM